MQALEGIRVLDLTHILAGPFCTYQLAVMGADVIKIEPTHEPDLMRECGPDEDLNAMQMGVMYLGQASNKRAIKLDLKSSDGQAVLKDLAKTADVIVENYRAGALAALGLGYEDIRAIQPDIVYCSMTGFGQTGPKAGHTAFDNVIQAYSGVMSATGSAETTPVMVGPPMLDYGTGAQAAYAVATALLRRERTGEGQRIDIAMLDAAMMLMVQTVMMTQATGTQAVPHDRGKHYIAGYGCYPASDGLVMLGMFSPSQHRRMWRVLGRDDLAEEAASQSVGQIVANRDRDEPILRQTLATRPADEWEEIFNAAGVPAARVRTVDQALETEQIAARPVLDRGMDVGQGSAVMHPAVAAFRCSEDGPALGSPPPKYGEHTDQILAELGYPPDRISALRASGAI